MKMPNISMNQQIGSLTVSELLELIRKAVREEITPLLSETEAELIPEPPPIRDIDTVIEKMKDTGKYNKSFLDSLRRGMQGSRTFKGEQR